MFERLLRALALCGGVLLLGLMGLITFDVVMRYVLRIPFLGAYEMTELAMALIVFLALPYCAFTGGHVVVDVFARQLDRPGLRWLNALVALGGAVITGVIAWQSALYAFASRSRGEATNMLKIDLFAFQLLAALSMALFCIVLLIEAFKVMRK